MSEARETALATASYVNALKAWSVFRSAVNFPDEADDLVLRLSLERLRFEAWGRVTGLERNVFDTRLFPVVELLDVVLKRIKKLFMDSDQLQARYGLGDDQRTMQRLKTIVAPQDGGALGREPRNVESLMSGVQQALSGRDSGSFYPSDRTDAGSIAETASIKTNISRRFSAPKKGRWALRDKTGFQSFVETVNAHINQLAALLSESLQRAFVEEQTRTSIALVGKTEDRATLGLVRRAALIAAQDLSFCRMVERKGISDTLEFNDFSQTTLTHRRQTSKGLINLSAGDFYMPESTSSRRFLTSSRTWQGSIVLLERKDFPGRADSEDLEKLDARIQRLAILLSSTTNSDLRTLHCLGYFADHAHSCWWLAFEFPHKQKKTSNPAQQQQVGGSSTKLTSSTRPVSLLRLMCFRNARWKPSLSARLKLASNVAATLSALYSGGWMHRSLRSANILFPYMYQRGKDRKPDLEGYEDIAKPLLAGFEYSQQEQEGWDGVIYRHPAYQRAILARDPEGRPPSYRVHYDIYSFGLILVEIALWIPLLDFLDANAADFMEDGAGAGAGDDDDDGDEADAENGEQAAQPRQLARKMDLFTPEDGRELGKRVMRVVRRELAFCVGAQYRDAAKWCLQYADSVAAEETPAWRSALEFYNRVVVPLSRLASISDA